MNSTQTDAHTENIPHISRTIADAAARLEDDTTLPPALREALVNLLAELAETSHQPTPADDTPDAGTSASTSTPSTTTSPSSDSPRAPCSSAVPRDARRRPVADRRRLVDRHHTHHCPDPPFAAARGTEPTRGEPMKITLDLPDITIDPSDDGGRDQDGAPYGLPDCPHCHTEYGGVMVRTTDGLVHDECAAGWLSRRDERDAWRVLAAHVARFPSRQSASAVRATIRALLDMQPRPTEES